MATTTLFTALRAREAGRVKHVQRLSIFPASVHDRLDNQFNYLSASIKALKSALDANRLDRIEEAVTTVINRLLNNPDPSEVFVITPLKRQEREAFVSLGGVDQLLRFFAKPFADSDARNMPSTVVERRIEMWNEVLVIMREVAFAVPGLSAQIFSPAHIVFLFTLLSHTAVFENTMNLLEEILSCRTETFGLASIPRLYSLLGGFCTRQLAHFCRVLSLVLFEPEDRQIMEGSQVLKSVELLQLRRDRMTRASNTVERNQGLVIDCPGLLPRLVQLMRLVNYGPQLADTIRHGIIQQAPITADLLVFHAIEWTDFDALDRQARGLTPQATGVQAAAAAAAAIAGGTTVPLPAWARSETDSVMEELLQGFSPPGSNRGGGDYESLHQLVELAVRLGVADTTLQGEHLLAWGAEMNRERQNLEEAEGRVEREMGIGGDRNRRNNPAPRASFSFSAADRGDEQAIRTRLSATTELMYHSMLLAPHQVELFFVLCTLLSGRRKIDVQERLAKFGLADVLLEMFDRLSWDAPPFSGPNPLEHVHGAGCECNPESALRVQFMRLVHNFYDRDFTQNTIKLLLLSKSEQELMYGDKQNLTVGLQQLRSNDDRGLLRRIIDALVREAPESVYRFWLSSCLEAYLRGSGPREQLFVAQAGVLIHTTQHILTVGSRAASNLQTSFDLLGEIVKNNFTTLDMLEDFLCATDGLFGQFMDVVLGNLVDSNVFLRSLFLSLECASEAFAQNKGKEQDGGEPTVLDQNWLVENNDAEATTGGYLSRSWIHFRPAMIIQQNEVTTSRSARKAAKAAPMLSAAGSGNGSTQNGSEWTPPPQQLQRGPLLPSTDASAFGSTVRTVRGAIFSLIAGHKPSQEDGGESKNEGVDVDVDGAEREESSFFTPPEHPRFPRASPGSAADDNVSDSNCNSNSNSHIVDSKLALEMEKIDLTRNPFTLTAPAPASAPEDSPRDYESRNSPRGGKEVRLGLTWDRVVPPSSAGWSLPDGLFRLGVFLTREREAVLLRLMDTVTVRTINHENICCLNTALLLLVLAHRRDQLATVLTRVRRLADEKAAIAGLLGDRPLDRDHDLTYAEEEAATTVTGDVGGSSTDTFDDDEDMLLSCFDCQTLTAPTAATTATPSPLSPSLQSGSRGRPSKEVCKDVSCQSCSFLSPAPRKSPSRREQRGGGNNGSDKVMCNFRELLWFWREYYLRRGRDRLSIEFSSRIPFSYWLDIVDLLCKDDGSPTALLKRPLALPLSPYFRSSRLSATNEYWKR